MSDIDNFAIGWAGGSIFALAARCALTAPGLALLFSIPIVTLYHSNHMGGREAKWNTPNLRYLSDQSVSIVERCQKDNFPELLSRVEKGAFDHVCKPSVRYHQVAGAEVFAQFDHEDPKGNKERRSALNREYLRLVRLEAENPEDPEIVRKNEEAGLPDFVKQGRRWTSLKLPLETKAKARG